MTRALVLYGDMELAGAIANGIKQQVTPANESEMKAEMATLRADLNRLRVKAELRSYGDQKRFRATKRQLAKKYSVKRHGAVYDALWGLYGLFWLGIYAIVAKVTRRRYGRRR